MNFLADESCAGPVILALRETGHDVVAIAEVVKGATDEQVLERAVNEKRVLITEDRDFGELVYARGRSSAGGQVSQPSASRQARDRGRGGEETRPAPAKCFTVVEPGRVRISGRP